MPVYKVPFTSVKNQARTGTCWSFSMTSLIESQAMKAGIGTFDLSEMFIVRNIYKEKARNYILRQGATQFSPGGLGHDVLAAMEHYGAMPEHVYSGLMLGAGAHDHSRLDTRLKAYLDSLLQIRPIPANWMNRFESLLDDQLGKVPATFLHNERMYTPHTFATEVLGFKADEYIPITSFTHHAYYRPFILEVPDNYSHGSYYNLPLSEMMEVVTHALENGFSVMWDADVSNTNFRQKDGYAMQWGEGQRIVSPIEVDIKETGFDEKIRQDRFESLITEDDHLMHLVGLERSAQGKKFFIVKNSWGEVGPFKGMIKVSEAYFAINTISLVVPKAALDIKLRENLGLK